MMSSTTFGYLIVLVLVSAAAFSTGWVLRDAQGPRASCRLQQ